MNVVKQPACFFRSELSSNESLKKPQQLRLRHPVFNAGRFCKYVLSPSVSLLMRSSSFLIKTQMPSQEIDHFTK